MYLICIGNISFCDRYEEYVQEFCDKYDSYCSINKILGNYRYYNQSQDCTCNLFLYFISGIKSLIAFFYRNEFLRMGNELELARGRDLERYNHAEAQLRDSFRLYGRVCSMCCLS